MVPPGTSFRRHLHLQQALNSSTLEVVTTVPCIIGTEDR